MICLQRDAVTEMCVLDDKCCLIRKRKVTICIIGPCNVSRTSILEVLCLFPAEISQEKVLVHSDDYSVDEISQIQL